MNQIGEEASSSSVKDLHGISGVTASEKRSNCSYGSGFPGFGHDSAGHGGKGVLFLLGLDKFGKGDWRNISRNFMISRTPTQVASHAQKYFIRLNSINRDRRRSSIHDITNVNGRDASAHQPSPITGQQPNSTSAMASIGPPPPYMAGLGMYGAPVGHPVAASSHHMASAVGTPVMLPPGHHNPYVVPVAYTMTPNAPITHTLSLNNTSSLSIIRNASS
ncbi:duplicated homeodomain-like superfamily protein [Actinidia rufa]|uniref:Duplicated homeodomain-like superfamily protein n=1 Tax=Actinidia rufa TaxID=165716 RepID=A0A7J0DUC8_9ERIC|nr:duplicated homeodomain-like superfamily protein [Actinidia rufa]